MKRAGVYVFYDSEGIVDGYVSYYLRELHKVVDYLVVVVNGKLTNEGRKVLVDVSDAMFVRENIGYDSWAYKAGVEFIGWDALKQYDELVLTNSSLFGPLYPFEQVFERMEADACDFWGMHATYENRNIKDWFGTPLKWGYKPDGIASNFLVFKKSVLESVEFRQFWNNLKTVENYFQACVYFEMELYMVLNDAGFVSSTVDGGGYRTESPSPTVYNAYDMIVKDKVPVIRNKAFYDPHGVLDYCTDMPRDIMKYIEQNTAYDCNMIWDRLLRTTNLYDLKNWFNLNQILPHDYAYRYHQDKRIAVIFHTHYDDIIGQYLHNIEAFPDGTDFFFTADSMEKLDRIKGLLTPVKERYHFEYRLIENRGRDVSALVVGCRDVVMHGNYDLICFMHDKKGIGNKIEYACVGHSYSDCCFENVAASAEYVANVIDLFCEQPKLGLAVPPPPMNANYYKFISGGWTLNYSNTVKLLEDLNIKVPMEESKPPVSAYGSVFWFRPEALMPLFQREWKYEDFVKEPMPGDGTISHVIERTHGFIAQSQGFYTSIIMNATYAEQQVTRMTEIAHEYVDLTLQYVGPKWTRQKATMRLKQMLQYAKDAIATATVNAEGNTPDKGSASNSKLQTNVQECSKWKQFIRAICPIGLWNLVRRAQCKLTGGVYIEPQSDRGLIKTMIRACMPRFLWNMLRRAKCKDCGWTYVED